MNQPIHKKVYYGWWVLSVAFISCFMFSGCIYFAFSLFIRPLQAEFGWDRSTIMFAFTLMVLTSGIASFFVGKTVAGHPPPKHKKKNNATAGHPERKPRGQGEPGRATTPETATGLGDHPRET